MKEVFPLEKLLTKRSVRSSSSRARDCPVKAGTGGVLPPAPLNLLSRKKLNGGICMGIEIIELNRNGVRVEEQDLPLPLQFHYFDDNGGSPDGNYDEDNIAGTWIVVSGKYEVGTYAYRSIDDVTLIKID